MRFSKKAAGSWYRIFNGPVVRYLFDFQSFQNEMHVRVESR